MSESRHVWVLSVPKDDLDQQWLAAMVQVTRERRFGGSRHETIPEYEARRILRTPDEETKEEAILLLVSMGVVRKDPCWPMVEA